MKNAWLLLILPALLFWACGPSSESAADTQTATEETPPAEPTPDYAAMWAGETSPADITEPGAPVAAPAGATSLTVNSQASQVYWRGAKVAYDHIGALSVAEGTLFTQDGKLAGGSITLDMTSIVNYDLDDPKKNADLVGHLLSPDFFDAANHPTASFVITSVTPGEGNAYTVSGNLTIKGITHQVSFPAEVSMAADGLSAQARFSIDRSKWDVRFGSGSFFEDLGDKLILDEIGLILDLQAS